MTAAKSEKKSEKDDFLEGEKTSRQQAAFAVGSLVKFCREKDKSHHAGGQAAAGAPSTSRERAKQAQAKAVASTSTGGK